MLGFTPPVENLADRGVLSPGQIVGKGFTVINQLGNGGAQADVYAARHEEKQYVIKLYHSGYRPIEAFIKNLMEHSTAYVAAPVDYGYEGAHYYEIYEFYEKGTLEEKGRCTLNFIKKVVVPGMNEGLHFLHTFNERGVIHGDIKPGNIFLSDDESHIIIGDFGISTYLDENGRLIDEVKGTPEYAPRTVAFFGKVTKSPAYDYGALGLVLIKLAIGHSLFGGLDIAAISHMWEKGIEIPDSIDGRLQQLITGLLVEDEQKRFGYEEVKRWCEGEFVCVKENSVYPDRGLEAEKAEAEPLIFGVFDEKIVMISSLRELSDAIIQNWDMAKKQLQRKSFYPFIAQFDRQLERDIYGYSQLQDEDQAVFFTL